MSGRKILIIDDDVTALDIVDYLFEDRGFHVVRRADGKSALDSITDVNPEIILVDLMMPLMNGQECIRRLRAMGYQVPIVAFTAIDDPEVHADALSAGCDMVLTKPCRPKTLLNKIEELLTSQPE
jgi:DNA-binding response OmpR family regulator